MKKYNDNKDLNERCELHENKAKKLLTIALIANYTYAKNA